MSRLAKKPLAIPSKVNVSVDGNTLTVTGGKEKLSRTVHSFVDITVGPEGAMVSPKNNTRLAHALTGTFTSHLKSMITGVLTPFKKTLILNGVGYKVEQKGKDLVFSVGFSHPVTLTVPEGITAAVAKNVITVEGANKGQVGQFAAEIRDVKPPEPYLGKGIKYEDEVILRKQGKKAV